LRIADSGASECAWPKGTSADYGHKNGLAEGDFGASECAWPKGTSADCEEGKSDGSDVLDKSPDRDWHVKGWFWVPEDTVAERTKKDRAPYEQWARSGLLKTTPGKVVDYDRVGAEIKELREKYRIESLAYDPWNAQQLANQLSGYGLNMVEVPQTVKYLSDPMKEVEALVIDKRLRHDGNPILRWMVGNTVAVVNHDGNMRPSKERSKEKIDGVMALVMAVGQAIKIGKSGGACYGGLDMASKIDITAFVLVWPGHMARGEKKSKYEEQELVVVG
jgi:phage terminase large subunit-like protein